MTSEFNLESFTHQDPLVKKIKEGAGKLMEYIIKKVVLDFLTFIDMMQDFQISMTPLL